MMKGETFKFERLISYGDHTSEIRAMDWSARGQILITGEISGAIKYFDSRITNVMNIQEAHNAAVRGLSFSPMESKFVSASDDGSLKIWDFSTHTAEMVLQEHLSDVKCVKWHPDRALVCSGSKDNTLKLWDPRQAKSVWYGTLVVRSL